uniref:ANF_receptor domain-containing protein n=1 Tax=Macrostomum lignano TaxID=282301 RepID=A0A1I8IYR1_9PLAT
MNNFLMLISILFLGSICQSSHGLILKIGVIIEAGNLNGSLIDVAFARRVNYNWRVLQGHTLSYVHVNVSSCSSHQAVRTVCSESGLSGLIGVGSCSLLDEVSSLSKSLQLPLIALPTGLCDSARLSKGVITEAGSLNGSLIDIAFARRVNYNWRVLQGHTLSYVHVNVSSCSSHQAVRTVCSESGLSGLIGVGSCSLLDEVSSLSKSLQLPLIALPTGLCDSARLSKDMTIVGSHSSENIVAAAATVLTSDSIVSSVAVFFDNLQSTTVLQSLQSSLSSAGVSSLTFRVDDTVNASVTPDLVHHLKRLVKKKVVLRLAREAAVMQQNYFWLVLDTGLSKADVLSVTPTNANVALLRGSVFTECTAAVMDVLPQCQTDWLRTLDARFVDAVEAMAKALNDSLLDPGFSPGNASCAPLRHWTSGSTVLNRLMSISDYDTQRGLISFNSLTRHFSSQRV